MTYHLFTLFRKVQAVQALFWSQGNLQSRWQQISHFLTTKAQENEDNEEGSSDDEWPGYEEVLEQLGKSFKLVTSCDQVKSLFLFVFFYDF